MTAFVAATVDMAGKPLLTVALTDDLVKEGHNASAMSAKQPKPLKAEVAVSPDSHRQAARTKTALQPHSNH